MDINIDGKVYIHTTDEDDDVAEINDINDDDNEKQLLYLFKNKHIKDTKSYIKKN